MRVIFGSQSFDFFVKGVAQTEHMRVQITYCTSGCGSD